MITALVLDDNRTAADTLVSLLDLMDIHARAAYSPKAALLVLQGTVPDVIFLDLNMPGLSGFEVIAYIRREPSLSEVPVIMVTSDDQPETAAQAYALGAEAVIIKPITFDGLEQSLRQLKLLEE